MPHHYTLSQVDYSTQDIRDKSLGPVPSLPRVLQRGSIQRGLSNQAQVPLFPAGCKSRSFQRDASPAPRSLSREDRLVYPTEDRLVFPSQERRVIR